MSHTPLPWSLEKSHDPTATYSIRGPIGPDGRRDLVAQVTATGFSAEGKSEDFFRDRDATRERTNANAALLVAAGELLAACRALVGNLQHENARCPFGFRYTPNRVSYSDCDCNYHAAYFDARRVMTAAAVP